MKRWWIWLCVAMMAVAAVGAVAAQTGSRAPSTAVLKTRLHAFIDRSLGWQGLDKMEVESISAPDAHGIRVARVLLAKGNQQKEALYYITSDGDEVIEGEASPLSADPWASTRDRIELRGAPVKGSANAPVTIVEFSDLECPFCKQESSSLRQLMSEDPGKVRLVFKFYPLTNIHPWSMQAAEAGVCVAEQGNQKFWDFEQAVFDAQEQITPADAAGRLRNFASEAGAALAGYDSCLRSPKTKQAVEASIANGNSVGVQSTPTLYVNGRMIPGAIQSAELKLLVDHEASFVHPHEASLAGSPSGQQCGQCKALPPLPSSKK